MAFTAFVVMRQQMMSSLDQSLLNRAHKATAFTTLSEDHRRRRARLDAGRGRRPHHLHHRRGAGAVTGDDVPDFTLGRPEYDVATGQRESVGAHPRDRGGRALPGRDRAGRQRRRPWSSPSRWPPTTGRWSKLGGVLFVFGALGVLAALLAGWLVARNGLRPVRRLTSAVEQHRR